MAKEELEKDTEEIVQESTDTSEDTSNTDPEETPEAKLQAEIDQLKDKLLRHSAEFDNFKKRTVKEREELYAVSVCDTVEKILPVKDNLERAVAAADETEGGLADGVKMIQKQLDEVLLALGVEQIKTVGEVFNPELHNAVMHEENEDFGENTVSEELMSGYCFKGSRVIRTAMVKVAN